MRGPVRLAAMAALLLASTAAAAPPRLSVGRVRGDARAALPAQLATALCGAFECVLWPEVSTGREPDLAKARARGVAGILVGEVAAGPTATLSLLTTSPRPARTWTFPLSPAGTLKATDLKLLERELLMVLRPAPAPAQPPATPPALAQAPPSVAAAAPPSPRPAPPPAPAPRAAEPARTPAAPAPAASTPPRAAEAAQAQPFARAQAGLFLMQRRLSYGGTGAMTGTLRAFDASSIVGPRLRVELFPASRSAAPSLRGAGLLLDYAASVGFETEAPTGGKRSTSFSRLEAGVLWRVPPLGALGLVLTPSLSYEALRLTVSPAIAGLPDAALSGMRLGVAAEAPVGDRFTLLAGVAVVKWLSAGDLIKGSPAYFPGGSAWAFELEAGAGMALWGPFSLRLLGDYASTSYSLDTDPTGTYAASSAQDRQLGLRLLVHGAY